MNKNNPKIEGPFALGWGRYPDYLNKCGSCGEEQKLGDEYRRTWNKELFEKTGGREGRTYYCVPCGERLTKKEAEEEDRERKRYKEEEEKNARKVIVSCSTEISSLEQNLTSENVAGTLENYKKIKAVQKRIKNLGNFEDLIIKGDIENLKKRCLDLTDEWIPPKIKKIGDKGKKAIHSPCCTSRNIKLEENDTESYYYCDYCWETESPPFLKSLKSYHIDKLNKLMLDNGVSAAELNSSSYQSMLNIPNFVLTQEGIKNTYQKAEQDLQDFLEKKGITITTSRERANSQQSQLRTQIQQLEAKPTRTSQEEQELVRKREELKKLEQKLKDLEQQKQKGQKQQPAKDKNLGLKIGIGVGVVGVLGGLVTIMIKIRRDKKNRD